MRHRNAGGKSVFVLVLVGDRYPLPLAAGQLLERAESLSVHAPGSDGQNQASGGSGSSGTASCYLRSHSHCMPRHWQTACVVDLPQDDDDESGLPCSIAVHA